METARSPLVVTTWVNVLVPLTVTAVVLNSSVRLLTGRAVTVDPCTEELCWLVLPAELLGGLEVAVAVEPALEESGKG